ncbi:5-formyltetrahydrofolate cyclo-ligase protein [Salinisphaera shabanensis E1L3A]|jgi:5-formyltetrahydrofolate cyclo-ligase|uniref:5-formyltetrahydrofolate cyclo-ligase n=1 Tax=Salinisphaera shabanensis E1L3A TaxID=1033802 RepID=U2E382_9GAMM|nr:5-formyltetrahydrofolate cyclo-ligase [Salinisphaera shabanensis]ERJ18346.1 5-formyltetrahydrofolate cyclo-ligase protein [Salinisphaera shabanensis E1L3A]
MSVSIDDQRRAALRARRNLNPAAAHAASRKACRRIARLSVFRRARRIGLYWPMRNEADPRLLLPYFDQRQQAFLPRVNGKRLEFIAFDGLGFRQRRSPLGIVEPTASHARPVATLDLLIVPLSAFDAAARRIGMGGGFYDRTLASQGESAFRGPWLLGLAFEVQRVERIATREWDVPLDAVASDAGIYRRATCPTSLR